MGMIRMQSTQTRSDRFAMSKLTLEHQFRGKQKPTKSTWRLMHSAEKMPFDALMRQLGSVKKPANRAAICLSAAPKAQTSHQVAVLSLEISRRTDATASIVNTIETIYPDSRAVQLVASEAARTFLSKLHSNTKKPTTKTKCKRAKKLDSVSLRISSIR